MDAPSLYHLTLAADWDAGVAAGTYTRSTVGRSLADEGFIHLSRTGQVAQTASRFYRGITGVVLVTLDPSRVGAPVVDEPVGDDVFPHLYGALDPAAALAVTPLPVGPDGFLELPDDLR